MTTTPPGAPTHLLLPGSIEEYLVSDVPVSSPGESAGRLRQTLAGRRFEAVTDVAVCEGTRLVGLVPLETVLAAGADVPMRDLMDSDPPVVAPGLDQEKAAWHAVEKGRSSLAVVAADGTFRGLVPPTRLMGVLLREHDEDVTRLAGVLSTTASAREATEEALGRRLWHRLPWLVVGLVGAGLSARFMQGFEAQLEADLRLAFFVPGVVYLADAVGTQTEALVIRGLSVGVSVRRVLRLETFTGVLLGLALGLASLVAVALAFRSLELGTVVGISLLAACSVATVVAMVLPLVMTRLGRDPAYGSGPLATVVQDLLSLLIYLTVARALLG